MKIQGPAELSAIPRYRQILRQHLPDRFFKTTHWNLLWFIPHGLVIGLALWLLDQHFSWWYAPVLGLLMGHSVGCLGFLAHEICHGGIKNKTLRHLLAGIGFSPFGIGPLLWSRWHNAEHHGHTQMPGIDPDHLFTLEAFQNNKVLKALYRISPILRNVIIFGFFTLMMSHRNLVMLGTHLRDPNASARDRAAYLFQFLFPKACWIGVTLVLGWQVFVFGYVLSLLVGNGMVITYISTNHFLNPLADERDVLAGSLSVTLPRWLAWVDVMHHRFGAHVSHHLFPHAPSRYSRKIEARIAELWPDRYHAMPLWDALKLLARTPWVYGADGKQFIDPQSGKHTPTLGHGL